jgi:hypothetical protein
MDAKPIVGLGTNLPAGRVVTIRPDRVILATTNGLKSFSFTEIERMVGR